MKVIYSTDTIDNQRAYVATIGTFDGVHLGHKMILAALKQRSEELNLPSLLITFYPHPRLVLNGNKGDLNFLNTQNEKLSLLKKAGVDTVLLQEFTLEFSQLNAKEFVEEYLQKKLNIKHLIVGYDHSFGKKTNEKQSPVEDLLQNAGIGCTIIPKQEIEAVSVSSTKIRKAIEQGDFEKANAFLGYEFSLDGKVVEGEKIGPTLGFPTANIQLLDNTKILPAFGVYAVKIKMENKEYFGMLNYGNKPTFGSKINSMEVHIFDFSSVIYGHEIQLFFTKKIRDERKFNSLDELKMQLEKDKMIVMKQ